MLIILRNYLAGAANEELLIDIEAADKTFQRLEVENYDDMYEAVLMTLDTVDEGDAIAQIVDITKSIQRDILKQHGVEALEELSIEKNTILINTLLDAQNFDDPAALMKICYQEDSPEEIFADIVQLVRSTATEEVLTWLVDVDVGLVLAVREAANRQEENIVGGETSEQHMRHIAQLEKFLDMIEVDRISLKIMRPIVGGMSVGFPFRVYADIVGRDLEELPNDQIANELIIMAIISNDGIDKIAETINANIERYISSADTIVKVASITSTRLVEFAQYEQA